MRSAFVVVVGFGLAASAGFAQPQADAPVAPREAPLRMTVPDGFKVTLFAGEPDVVQPIAFTFDDRGRLWVVECLSYPHWIKDGKLGKDRVLIFEDTDGDGQHDKRTVFADKLANLTGINYGFGGIWLCSLPNLLFIPDKDGDDRPDGPPEIKLNGWSLLSGHNAFNGIKWGPDGWLYGCNGITATSHVGVPGTPAKDRTPMNCGVWRYHPTKKKFEVVAHGTTNPWGLDWDEHGELFITNCVIDHVWHVVPGGHYERMYGQDFNPHLYKLMPSIADHKHWAGGSWTDSRGGKGAHSDAGGGHAHAGCMVYLGDNFPAKYRNTLFTLNLHGSRINNDILERKGSTYVAKHGKDFLFANDPWFRGLGIDYGPDGGVYVSDWCDTGECHNYQVAHTATGRIYKIVYGRPRRWHGDLATLTDKELVELQAHKNEWFVRRARRLLAERSSAGRLDRIALNALVPLDAKDAAENQVLRSMWTRHVTGSLATQEIINLIQKSPHETVRAIAVSLAVDDNRAHVILGPDEGRSPLEEAIHDVASEERSPLVRLHIASAAQRFPAQRFPKGHLGLVTGWHLSQFSKDEHDPFLPLMIWYAVQSGPIDHMVALVTDFRLPFIRQNLARRVSTADTLGVTKFGIANLVGQLKGADSLVQRDILRGIHESLKGRRAYQMPTGWQTAYAGLNASSSNEVRDLATSLAVIFGDEKALVELRSYVQDPTMPVKRRRAAIQSLLLKQSPSILSLLHSLLDDSAMRESAIQALAVYADETTPRLLVERYGKFTTDEKSAAISTLSARPEYALALLDAVEKKIVPRQDLNAFMVRQLLALKHPKVTERVNQVWGALRSPSADKAAHLTKLKKQLEPAALTQANLAQGRALFTKHCAACHKLFGEGGAIGPELTGSQRTNLDYLLENMLDPSAVVPREYQVQIVVTSGGRTITGIVKEETERALTVQTQNEVIIVPKDEIEVRRQSNLSMMPEGVIEQLRPDELRDLVAYLASSR
jgi:putative membrane-bound dehydrogenase-like protein